MNVTGILRRSIRSKMGILAYAPGASICAVIPPAPLGTRALGDLDLGNWGLTNTILSTPLHHARPVDVRM